MDNSETYTIFGTEDTGRRQKTREKKMSNTDPINKTGVNPCAHEWQHGPINKTGMNPGAHEWRGVLASYKTPAY